MKNDAIMYIDVNESFFMWDDEARSICSELDQKTRGGYNRL